MPELAQIPLETAVRSNEKLIKAVIALMALKDEHFLAELRTIFTIAARDGSSLAEGDAAVWAEIERRLQVIESLLHGGEERSFAAGDGHDGHDGGGHDGDGRGVAAEPRRLTYQEDDEDEDA